jgi:hypothetical protein
MRAQNNTQSNPDNISSFLGREFQRSLLTSSFNLMNGIEWKKPEEWE